MNQGSWAILTMVLVSSESIMPHSSVIQGHGPSASTPALTSRPRSSKSPINSPQTAISRLLQSDAFLFYAHEYAYYPTPQDV